MTTQTLKTLAMQLALAMAAYGTLGATPALAHDGEPHGDFNLEQALNQARKATAHLNTVHGAMAAGYTKFPDLHGDCVAQPGQGGMGVHYVNAALLDEKLDPLRPEFLVYGKTASGKQQLVALEYVVFAPLWDALNPQPPVLFGHPFHLVRTPNRYGTADAFYELHVWAWEHNPNGLFNDWNPNVSC